MSHQISSSGRPTFKKSVNSSCQAVISHQKNSYTNYEENINNQIQELARRFPKKSYEQLQKLIEEFDSMELAMRKLTDDQKIVHEQSDSHQQEVLLKTFNNNPDIRPQEENKCLKEALVLLYKQYLGKVKQAESLKKKLQFCQQKIKRTEFLHKFISKDRPRSIQAEEFPNIHNEQEIQNIIPQLKVLQWHRNIENNAPFMEGDSSNQDPVL